MEVPQCGVCHKHESKYKCPVCELRYCSLPCYKTHHTSHADDEATVIQRQAAAKRDRPGTKHRVTKVDFTGFEHDADLTRLLTRYPNLRAQLQVAYGLTLEPGPDDKWTWARGPLLGSLYPSERPRTYGRGRGHDRRGGGRHGRVGRGGRHPQHETDNASVEERQRGLWAQDKGDKEALLAIKKMRTGGDRDELAEGMREFIELCQIKFGQDRKEQEEAQHTINVV